LERNADKPEPAKDYAEWLMRVAAEKGRADRLMRHM
jgi:hypothetical protein